MSLLNLSGLLDKNDLAGAVAGYDRLLGGGSLPAWARAEAFAGKARALFGLGDRAGCLIAMEEAVKAGFDCYPVFRDSPHFKGLHGDPTFRELYGRMRVSPADDHEAGWLFGEIRAVNNDTTTMIQENMNRKDGDWTQVPQVPIPDRPTRSATVTLLREVLRITQFQQKRMVAESDRSRISHRTMMGGIANWPGSRSDNPIVQDRRDQNRQADANRDRQLAQQRYQQRLAQVRQRQYVPAGGDTNPVPVPPLP